MTAKRMRGIFIGPFLFTVFMLLPISSLDAAQKAALGTMMWMSSWWISRPVHIGVTALLPIVLNAYFNMVPMNKVIANYASEIVLLVLGANIITITWETTGLDKRISLGLLCTIGSSLKQQIAAWFLVATALSVFLPNAVVCAILTPVAVAMLHFVGEKNITESRIATVILLAVAWGSGLGGAGSPLGGAMNLVAIEKLEEIAGREFMYITWITRILPLMLVLAAANIAYLFFIAPPIKSLHKTDDYFKEMFRTLPAMGKGEKIGAVLFGTAVLLSFTRPLFADFMPGLKPAYVFLTLGLLTFLLPAEEGKPLLTWNEAEKKIIWGLLFLFAGGLAVGTLIGDTGAAAAIGALVANAGFTHPFALLFMFTVVTVILANISSNTAAAAIATPIVVSTVQGLGYDPVPFIYITVLAFNSAYVLPTSVRAIPVGYGLDPQKLFRSGLAIAVISIVLIVLMGMLCMTFWPGFSVV
jgi:sodium-dependent dicarboxylate transporter 2/3/5